MHAGFNAQLTIAHASLAVAGAAAARSSYMDELSHQTSADTPGALHIGEQRVSTCSFAPRHLTSALFRSRMSSIGSAMPQRHGAVAPVLLPACAVYLYAQTACRFA